MVPELELELELITYIYFLSHGLSIFLKKIFIKARKSPEIFSQRDDTSRHNVSRLALIGWCVLIHYVNHMMGSDTVL